MELDTVIQKSLQHALKSRRRLAAASTLATVSLLFSSAQRGMAPNIQEWWRIPYLPTEETYIISEDHTVVFEQIIEEYPEF